MSTIDIEMSTNVYQFLPVFFNAHQCLAIWRTTNPMFTTTTQLRGATDGEGMREDQES